MEVDAMADVKDDLAHPPRCEIADPKIVELKHAADLDAIQAAFAVDLARSLSEHLGQIIDISPHTIESLRYSDFLTTLSCPTCLCIFRIDPPNAHGCLDLSPAILFPMIDTLLGGKPRMAHEVPQRGLTQIEQGFALQIVERAAGQLADKLSVNEPVCVREEGLCSDPAQIRLMPADEVLTVMRFHATIGNHDGVIRLGLPAPVTEMIATAFDTSPQSLAAPPTPTPNAHDLEQQAVDLHVLLAETKLRLDEILSLSEGDIITTDVPIDAPIALRYENQSIKLGKLAEFDGRYVFEITDGPAEAGGER
jgi:flagellar motor switch protein FliM